MASDSANESMSGSPVGARQSPEPGEILHIKCGLVTAKLHMDRFLCPGIHQECIEVEDGAFVTPKTFAVMGEKEKLKDWKNAIRLNGRSIRKMMETGDLEFSRHNEICTGRCASRNMGTSKYDIKIEQLQRSTQELEMSAAAAVSKSSKSRRKKRTPQSLSQTGGDLASLRTLLTGPLLNEPGFTALREAQGEQASPSSGSSTLCTQPVFPSAVLVPTDLSIKAEPMSQADDENSGSPSADYDSDSRSNHVSMVSGYYDRNTYGSRMNGDADKSEYLKKDIPYNLMNGGSLVSNNHNHSNETNENHVQNNSEHSVMNKDVLEAIRFAKDLPDTDSLLEDSVAFWQNILDLGLLDSFFREIKKELDRLKNEFSDNHKTHSKNGENIAQSLTNVVSELGLMTKLKWQLAEAKSRTEREKEDLSNHIELLKKHVAESEQKQRELKRKSECFETLADLGRAAKRRASSTPNSALSSASSPPVSYREDKPA